jgi:hypothetical protein
MLLPPLPGCKVGERTLVEKVLSSGLVKIRTKLVDNARSQGRRELMHLPLSIVKG